MLFAQHILEKFHFVKLTIRNIVKIELKKIVFDDHKRLKYTKIQVSTHIKLKATYKGKPIF